MPDDKDNDGAADNNEQIKVENEERKIRNPFKIQKYKEEKERRQKKRARIIVRNLSYKVTEDILKEHFVQWGEIEDLNLLKRPDGKLVGCAFIQYATINQATKAILKGNSKPLLERPIYIDWAIGKDEYKAKKKDKQDEKIPKDEVEEEKLTEEVKEETQTEDKESNTSEMESEAELDGKEDSENEIDAENDSKSKVKKEKVQSNDVQEGCTVFIKNVPFDASDNDLRKEACKYGPIYYAIINRQAVTGHSKGTAFVKFKRRESADMCLQAGPEFMLMNEILEVHPALSRDELSKQEEEKNNNKNGKDSRNLYLAREGLIMAGSKAAQGVSASDMAKRLKLEQIKTEVLKNLNR